MKFISKPRNLTLVRKPSTHIIVDGYREKVQGERVKFENHELSTKDQSIIKWLQHHRLHGIKFTSAEEEKADKKD